MAEQQQQQEEQPQQQQQQQQQQQKQEDQEQPQQEQQQQEEQQEQMPATIEEKAGCSDASTTASWQAEDADMSSAEEAVCWQKKFQEEETFRKKIEAEARVWRIEWQKQAEEAGAREEKVREELRKWQDKAAEQGRKRAEAEFSSAKWENRAEREAGLRRIAEEEAANLQFRADQEEIWRKRWQEKAEVEEKLRDSWQQKAKAVECECQQWQKKAKEQETLFKEETRFRQKAEAEASGCKRLEEETLTLKKKVEEEESLRRQCEQLAEKEEGLRKEWHSTGQQNKRRRIDEQMQIEREAKDKADTAAKEWQGKAEQLEKEVEQWKRQADEQEGLRKKNEEKAEARIKEIQDDTIAAHGYSCMGLGRCPVTYAFKGFKAAREANKALESPELTFQIIENPSLNYSFRLNLYPNGCGDASKGAVGLYWVPRVGSQPAGTLMWPIPHGRVKIGLRILSLSAKGMFLAKQRKVDEKFIDGTANEGTRSFFAKHAPPSRDNAEGHGWHDFLTKARFEEGGWTMGPDADIMVVQAELILK